MSELPTILFSCEACGIQGRVPESFRGKTARCPSCKHVQIIPMDAPSPPSSGATQRIAQPTITRSFANPKSDEPVSDATRSRALLGIIERLEKVESLNERLHGSMQRLQTRSHAGDDDTDQRISQLQTNLTQTQHAVTGLHHMETRLEAMGKKIEVLQRATNRNEENQQINQLFDELKRLQRQVDNPPTTGKTVKPTAAVDLAPLEEQLTALNLRLDSIEEVISAEDRPDSVDQASAAALAAYGDDLAELRAEHEQRLANIYAEITELKTGRAAASSTGETADDSDSIASNPTEYGQMAEDLTAVQEELGQLRALVAEIPEPSEMPAASTTTVVKGSPALAIFALLVGLAGAGLGGFTLMQQQEQVKAQANALNSVNASITQQDTAISSLQNATKTLENGSSSMQASIEAAQLSIGSLRSTTESQISDLLTQLQAAQQAQQALASGQETLRTTLSTELSSTQDQLNTLRDLINKGLSSEDNEANQALTNSIEAIRGQIAAMSTKLEATTSQLELLQKAQNTLP